MHINSAFFIAALALTQGITALPVDPFRSDRVEILHHLNKRGPIERSQMCLDLEADTAAADKRLRQLGGKIRNGFNDIRKRDPYSANSATTDLVISCEIEKALEGKTWGEVRDDTISGVKNSFGKGVDFVRKPSGQNLASEPDVRPTAPLPNPLDTIPGA